MPNLFGQSHLSQTQAVTDHANYRVRFNHQALNFTVNCRNSSPFEAFPSLASIPNSGGSGPGVNVTCLLTSTPLPNALKQRVQFHRGFNIVTLSFALTASLLGTSVLTSPLWLDGQEIYPGVHVVSGPISLTRAQTHVSIVSPQSIDFSSFTGPFNYPKCRPSQPMPEPEPVHIGVLSAEHVDTIFSSVMLLTSLPPTRSMSWFVVYITLHLFPCMLL